jgi:hypothetical protein
MRADERHRPAAGQGSTNPAEAIIAERVKTMQNRQSCFAAMLDIRNIIMAVRATMSSAETTVVIVMIIVFAIIGLCLAPLWTSYDLASTWSWATTVKDGSSAHIGAIGAYVETKAPQGALLLDMTMGQIITGLIVLGITLLPTLFELGFPSIRHPLLMLLLSAAILFDYITDFGSSWAATSGWGGADNWFIHFLWTALIFNPFVSVGVQALLVVCITVIIFGFIRLARGGSGPMLGDAMIIRQ